MVERSARGLVVSRLTVPRKGGGFEGRRRQRNPQTRSNSNGYTMLQRRSLICLLMVAAALLVDETLGHVALTFPRARKYDLDFLDSARTPGPCGMPRGDIKTSFLSGSKFNVSWHLAYPHRGGFRLQILDALDRPLVDLTPVTKQSEFVEDDATAQNYPVELPQNFTCTDCTVRLLREAEEWGSTYRFWSCADIDILERKAYREDCSGHGRYLLGRCRCDRFYHGPRCEFREDCLDDSDCGNQGTCVDNHGTTAPTKHCYCNVGWFGPGCNKRSTVKTMEIDFDGYTMKRFSNDYTFYWRIIKDTKELEGVIVVNGTSWVGLGWRPTSLTPDCRAFPDISDRTDDEPLPKPEPKAEPTPGATKRRDGAKDSSPEPEPEAAGSAPEPTSRHSSKKHHGEGQPEPEPEGSAKPEPEPTSEPLRSSGAKRRSAKPDVASSVTQRIPTDVTVQTRVTYQVSAKQGRRRRSPEAAAPEPTGEPISEPEPKSHPEPSSEPEPKSHPEPASEPEPNSHPEPSSEPEPRSHPEPSSEPEPKSHPEPSSEPEPKSHPEPSSEPEPKSHPEPSSEPEPKSHPEPSSEPEPKSHPEPSSEPEPKSHPEPSSEPEPKSHPEPSSEPEPKSHPEPSSEPEPKSHPEPSSEPEPKSHPEPSSEPEPKSHPEPSSEPEPKSHPEPTSEPEPKSHPEPSSEPEPKSHPEPTSEPEPNSHPDPQSEPEPSSIHAIGEPEPSTKSGATKAPVRPAVHKYTPKHDFNPMDCTDMVIGMARGNTHRIGDYYTRDRSTPRLDAFWGGRDSLTAAMGFEKDGVTTIVFRRKLASNELTDHEIMDGEMQVIWAKGQEPGKYVHEPPSGVEKSKVSVKDFYKVDELKYHGHRSQRGVASFNFFDEKNKEEYGGHTILQGGGCGGEWRHPRHCSTENGTCEYYIKWTYKTKKDQMSFTIITNNTSSWTGVGFSDDEKMSQTDAILGWVDQNSGRPFIMDTWTSGYNSPLLDPSQDIYNVSGRIEDGMTTLRFSRKRITKDIKDLSFTDDKCLYMMFPVRGGNFNAVNKKIRKHRATPIVSSERICIRSCGVEEEDDEGGPVTPAPPRLYYDVEVKLVNLGDGFQAPEPGTPDFEDISNAISDNFGPTLGKLPGYYRIKLNELQRNGDDGVIAKMNLILDKNEGKGRALRPADTVAVAEGALKEALLTGRVGSLTVDPQYLVVRAPLSNDITNDDYDVTSQSTLDILSGSMKLYVVIGIVAALVALVLLQASCTLYKATRKRTTKQERLIANNAWRDYSSGANTNFAFEAFETEEKAPPPPVSSLPRSRDMTDNGAAPRSSAAAVAALAAHPVDSHRSHQHTNNGHHHHHHQQQQQQQQQHQQHQMMSPRATYSLPRAPGSRQPPPPPQPSYYTQDRRNNRFKSPGNGNATSGQSASQQPDFYFMPSQRKYSGEVVRVYVDYGNQKPK